MDQDAMQFFATNYVAPMLGVYGVIRLWMFAKALIGGS